MSNTQPNTRHSRWHWIVGVLLFFAAGALLPEWIVIHRAGPILRERVIETLATRFKSKVELDRFHVSLLQGLQVSGEGLRLFGQTDPNNLQPGVQPLISVAEFRFRTDFANLIRSPMHVDTVHIKGLVINLPPKGERGQMSNIAPKGGKIKIVVDKF